ncbi:cation acetate symporter [Egicoccus sp. AB-alg6-2]|uniref:solute symporter family protein n=1 Tax=Egicoccus sp. AB-alg6-2 TaxID=3242692 RepID=UPI00359E82E8
MSAQTFALLLVLATIGTLVSVTARARGRATTLDFYLAGRRVGTMTNACAICGDYFSAASFLGVAAAVYASGLDGVWYAAGFAAGFVPVLLFVAAPLRRFGRISLPDFLGERFASERVRLAAVVVVQLVVLAYLVPQAVGSGITWELLVGRGFGGLSPYATGVVVSAALIAALVVIGGMRGTTWNQALQFVLLLVVLSWLATLVLSSGFSYPGAVEEASAVPLQVPANDGAELTTVPDRLRPDREAVFGTPGARYGGLGQFALLTTLMLGTAGLPHIMNRYFTSPTGRSTRFTTVWVLGLAGAFYALAVLLGTAARVTIAEHAADNDWLGALTVDGVLRVPEHALLALGRIHAGVPGLGLVATAAFAAMISTIGGLLLAAAASWGHDVYERYLNPRATQRQAIRAGQLAVVVASAAAALVALALEPARLSSSFPSVVALLVTWAFALAGSALTPVLLLAIWWRGVSARGAIAGMSLGTLVVIGSLAVGLLRGGDSDDLGSLLLAPTLMAAPAAALVTILVSRVDGPPPGITGVWLRMHGTAADRQVERFARMAARQGRDA